MNEFKLIERVEPDYYLIAESLVHNWQLKNQAIVSTKQRLELVDMIQFELKQARQHGERLT